MEKMALALAETRPGSRSGTPPNLSSPRLLAAATWHAPSNLAACKSMMAYGPTQQQQSQVNWEQMHSVSVSLGGIVYISGQSTILYHINTIIIATGWTRSRFWWWIPHVWTTPGNPSSCWTLVPNLQRSGPRLPVQKGGHDLGTAKGLHHFHCDTMVWKENVRGK